MHWNGSTDIDPDRRIYFIKEEIKTSQCASNKMYLHNWLAWKRPKSKYLQEIEMICQIIWYRQLQTHISGKWFRPLSLLTTYPFRNICSSFLIMMNKFWWPKKVLNLARNWVLGLVLVFLIFFNFVFVSFNLSLLAFLWLSLCLCCCLCLCCDSLLVFLWLARVPFNKKLFQTWTTPWNSAFNEDSDKVFKV